MPSPVFSASQREGGGSDVVPAGETARLAEQPPRTAVSTLNQTGNKIASKRSASKSSVEEGSCEMGDHRRSVSSQQIDRGSNNKLGIPEGWAQAHVFLNEDTASLSEARVYKSCARRHTDMIGVCSLKPMDDSAFAHYSLHGKKRRLADPQ